MPTDIQSLQFSRQQLYRVAVSLLLPIGIVGTYYKSIGAACSWILILLLMFQIRTLEIDRKVVVKSLALIGAISLGSLLAVKPIISLEGCGRILISMLFFIPGVFLGRQLDKSPLPWWSVAPLTALYGSHFFYPRNHGDIKFFGLSDNPNTVGQGLVFGLFILLIAAAAEFLHLRSSTGNRRNIGFQAKLRIALIGLTAVVSTTLLIMANCRQGWLSVAIAAVIFCMANNQLTKRIRAIFALSAASLLAALVYFRDQKGFGYGSVGERLDLWTHSLQAWAYHFPLFGAGYGSFEDMAEFHYYGNVTMAYWNPHNILIELLFSGGIWGVACFLIYILAIRKELAPAFAATRLNAITLTSFAGLAGLLALGMLDMGLTSTRYIGSIATLVGVLYSQARPSFPGAAADG